MHCSAGRCVSMYKVLYVSVLSHFIVNIMTGCRIKIKLNFKNTSFFFTPYLFKIQLRSKKKVTTKDANCVNKDI